MKKIKMVKKQFKSEKGFSLVEITVVIGVMVVLIALLVPFLVGFVDEANKAACQNDAKTLMDAAQIAVATAAYKENESFIYAAKYEYNGKRVARFTNNSLAQAESNNVSNRKSGASDKCIGENILKLFPAAKGYVHGTNPIDTRKSTQEMVDNPSEFGTMPFAFTYDKDGNLVYFETVCHGYFFKMLNGEITVEKVGNDVYFEDWPTSAHKIAGAGDW